MFLTLANVLSYQQADEIRSLLPTLRWEDGAKTAGRGASAVKSNLQADLTSRTGAALKSILETAIRTHPVLRAATQPKRFSSLLVSKTEMGGGYGMHIDNPVMKAGDTEMRVDASFTLFLQAPDQYDGGELSIDHSGFTQNVKLPLGDMVIYPSTFLHEVRPVTAGTRLVCVGWIESRIADPAVREILFDLSTLRAELEPPHPLQSAEMLALQKAIANLTCRFG